MRSTQYCKTKQHPLIPIRFLAIMICSTAVSTFDFYTKLFNRLLPSGIFHDGWKLSSITPVFKPGDPSLVYNYCPISFHCHLNYLRELSIIDFLSILQITIISPAQFSFLQVLQCNKLFFFCFFPSQSCLAYYKASTVSCVSIDLSKAFDKVPRSGIFPLLGLF